MTDKTATTQKPHAPATPSRRAGASSHPFSALDSWGAAAGVMEPVWPPAIQRDESSGEEHLRAPAGASALGSLAERERAKAKPVAPRLRYGRVGRLLAVGEDPSAFRDLARHARAEGATLQRAPNAAAALRALAHESYGLVFVSLEADRLDDLRWWDEALDDFAPAPRIVAMVSEPALALDVAGMGPYEMLPLPVDRERFSDLLHRVGEAETDPVIPLMDGIADANDPYPMLSQSPGMLSVFRAIAQVAPTNANVLVTGESGTGKELVARMIHRVGPRAEAPFVALHCAAIPEQRLESELFGHERGAFAGAVSQRAGRFERASGGTLFLDEVGDTSLALQSKILRAIKDREIERVGGTRPIGADVRLIAALNRDPVELVAQGRLRDDLHARLAVVTIHLPRLAERGDDLFLLTCHFVRELSRQYGKTITGVSERALDLLRQHDWIGNVRELRNVIERAALLCDGEVIRPEHLPDQWRDAAWPANRPQAPLTLREVEARHIADILHATRGQIGEAAKILGLHRNTLARKIRQYGI